MRANKRTNQTATSYRQQMDDDHSVLAELVEQLYRAGEGRAGDLVAGFSTTQRAHLAVYCYHKAHLHRIGLAIAATCERPALELTWGRALGKALFEQSRELALTPVCAAHPYRPSVTLATLEAIQAERENNLDWADDEWPPDAVSH